MFELYICRIGCFCWNLSRKSYTSTSDLLLFLVFNIVSDQYVTQLAILMISWWQMHSYVFNTPNQKKILHNSGENIFFKTAAVFTLPQHLITDLCIFLLSKINFAGWLLKIFAININSILTNFQYTWYLLRHANL